MVDAGKSYHDLNIMHVAVNITVKYGVKAHSTEKCWNISICCIAYTFMLGASSKQFLMSNKAC